MSKKPAPEPVTRKSVSLPDDIWEEITSWRLARRISTEAEAIRQIILAGLAAEKRKVPRP
jgi:metal-responsive CopG/Arc/MetJ family transcriptional regulator